VRPAVGADIELSLTTTERMRLSRMLGADGMTVPQALARLRAQRLERK
ncbi:MAG: hypothetical protein JWQ16_2470, partial [Novosphingobium sp.]|nr:hypothetical protein [Novosphingobium sp.]